MSLLTRLASLLARHFWGIWAIGLLGILVVSVGMFWKGWRDDGWVLADDQRPTSVAKPKLWIGACFAAFLAVYVGFMLWGEDFAFQDGHAFTEYSAIGVPRPPSIWNESGRFWPLGYDEYNLIAHLSATAPAYLVLGAIQLVIGLWFLYRVMPTPSPTVRLVTFVVLMLAPAFGADFAELTYADRNVAFIVCMLVFFVDRYDRRPALSWLVPAIVMSYSALYYKETTAALMGGFAATRLLLRWSRQGWRSAWRSPLEVGILASCACFGVQLSSILIPAGRSKYVAENYVGRATAAARYMTADPLLSAFLLAFAVHVVMTLRSGKKFDPLWDALGFGGVLHFIAVSITGLEEDYLMGPTEIVAAVTLARLVPGWWQERPKLRPMLAAVGGVVVAATTTFGVYRLIERKNVVWQTQRLAAFLINHYQPPVAGKERVYHFSHWQTSSPAHLHELGTIMNFISFLEYKGLPVHKLGEAPGVEAPNFAGDEPFEEDRCVYYERFVCKPDVMRPGDIVIRLPEDDESPAAPPGQALETIFQESPTDSPLRPLLAVLFRLSPTMRGYFPFEPLPDDWIRVSAARVIAAPSAQK